MCGIVGIVDSGGVSLPIYYALYALQHRGQESAGITTYDAGKIHKHKAQGLLSEVFDQEILKKLTGRTGIGHIRYPTTGENRPENTQPLNFTLKGHYFSIVHNGNLVNNDVLVADYEEHGHIFATTTDSEVIAAIIARERLSPAQWRMRLSSACGYCRVHIRLLRCWMIPSMPSVIPSVSSRLLLEEPNTATWLPQRVLQWIRSGQHSCGDVKPG